MSNWDRDKLIDRQGFGKKNLGELLTRWQITTFKKNFTLMKSIVTGGAGFIGSNLVDKLVSLGHKVTVIDNLKTGRLSNLKKSKRKIKFIKADITKGNLDNYFKNHDYVFHLAGLADIVPSIKNPYFYFDTNVNGTIKVLEYAKKNKVKKFIYAASASAVEYPKISY